MAHDLLAGQHEQLDHHVPGLAPEPRRGGRRSRRSTPGRARRARVGVAVVERDAERLVLDAAAGCGLGERLDLGREPPQPEVRPGVETEGHAGRGLEPVAADALDDVGEHRRRLVEIGRATGRTRRRRRCGQRGQRCRAWRWHRGGAARLRVAARSATACRRSRWRRSGGARADPLELARRGSGRGRSWRAHGSAASMLGGPRAHVALQHDLAQSAHAGPLAVAVDCGGDGALEAPRCRAG